MESKKINQLATNVAPQTSDLTIIGDPITGVSKKITLLQIANLFATTGTVTSVAVTETGDALTITGSPITSAGTINIGFAGDATQYVRGDGALADFPTSTGGGSSVSYYLNSSVSQGTIGGVAYREFSKDPIAGAGTDITASTNGYIASYITDANDPALLEVPAGNFNCEFYFSVNSNAHNPYVYAEVYKYDGTTFTLIGSSQSVPEYLTSGTTLSPYYFAIPVTQTTLAITDRLAIRIYANVDTRTVTLHTENNHLCQVVTTFSKGLTSLNNLTRQVQFLATGTSGTDFNISSSTATHTFNLPVASATNTGKLSSTDWSTFNNKQPAGNYVTLDTTQTITAAKTFSGVNTFSQNPVINGTGTNSAYTILQSDGTNKWRIGNNYASGVNTFDIFAYDNSTTPLSINSNGAMTLSANVTTTGAQFVQNGFYLTNANGGALAGYTLMHGADDGINFALRNLTGGARFIFQSATSYNYTFPAATGTLALTSDLSGYVTISTTQTITGAKTFTQNLALDGNGSNAGTLLLKSNTALPTAIGYTSLNTTSNTIYLTTYVSNPKTAAFDLSGITDNTIKTFTLPNTNGTLALTSNLSAYLPLTGGTLTGGLSGTSATFSGDLTIDTNTLYVDSTNNRIGIGTSSPSNKLTISNNGNAAVAFRINDTNANASFLSLNASNTDSAIIAGGTSAIPFDIYTGGVARMRITSGGDISFNGGSASSGNSTATPKNFRFNNDYSNGTTDASLKLYLFNEGATIQGLTSGPSFDLQYHSSGNNTTGQHVWYIGNTQVMKVQSTSGNVTIASLGTGTVTATSGTLSTVSDMNLKNEDGFINNALDKVLKLKPRYYHWKKESGLPTDLRQLGFYAQEVNEALGEEAANTPKTENDKWGIYDRGMIAFLTAAIQEQQVQIEELKQLIKNK
jgi:hypothetical protein